LQHHFPISSSPALLALLDVSFLNPEHVLKLQDLPISAGDEKPFVHELLSYEKRLLPLACGLRPIAWLPLFDEHLPFV
jgi:hypothetical protein